MEGSFVNKCIYRFAEVLSAFDIFGFGLDSLASLTGGVELVDVLPDDCGGGEGVAVPLASPLLEPWWTLLLDGPAPEVDMEQLLNTIPN